MTQNDSQFASPAVSRRSFMKGSALAGLGAVLAGATPALYGCSADMEEESSDPQLANASKEKVVWTHCAVNCGCCCAWKAHVVDGTITYIETDDTGSAEFGDRQLRACGRGRSARRWIQHPDRLNVPLKRKEGTKRGEGLYEEISWDEALDIIAEKLKHTYEAFGPEAVTSHYASGVSSSVIGGAAVSRLLNMAGGQLNYYGSYSSAQIAAAGTYTYGGGTYGSNFFTLQDNQLVVLFADAVAEGRPGGCGEGYDLAVAREQHNCRVISIDPRCNDITAGQTNFEWIPIRPGTDGALVSALAYEIISNGWADEDFLRKYCVGYDEETLPESAKGKHLSYKEYILGTGYDMLPKTPAWAAPITGIPEKRIIDLARELHEADPVYIGQGYGLNRRSNGEITARAVMVLPQLLGQIGKPGTNDGRREGNVKMGLPGLPTGTNPVKTTIPTFEWPNAIDHGHELTALNAGVQKAERMSSDIKFIFNYAGNTLTNQHSDINYTHDLLVDESKCEFIVTVEVFMTDSAKYSDIILPDLTVQEQLDICNNGYADNQMALIFGSPVYEPKFERRGIYEVCCDLAERLGFGEKYSEGKTREDWYRTFVADLKAKKPQIPSFEEGLELGVYKEKTPEVIALKDYIADPAANPLKTPSGKIEIYSETLAGFAEKWELADDEVVSPIPAWDPGFSSYLDCDDEYPLLISGFQSKAHTHSSYANNEVIASVTVDSVWINPLDADPRGIKTGDACRIFTKQGEIRLPALVTPLVMPGTTCVPAGRWHDADMAGDRVDHGGCINTLTLYRPSPLAKANPQHSNYGQVLKA